MVVFLEITFPGMAVAHPVAEVGDLGRGGLDDRIRL